MISFIQCAKSSNTTESTDNSDQTCTLHDISISITEIFETLITLDPNKASGIDNISPRVLKFSALPLSSPICHLFQQCFVQSYLPQEWRTHCVVPIYKSGDKTLISNYHPVSLLCSISKVLEKIVFKVTYDFLAKTFSQHQFGFLPGWSTLQQLLIFISKLLEAMSENMMADVVYLDFRKAFDSVPHSKLLSKLRSYGITGTLWRWFDAYLNNRTQSMYVRINNTLSHSVNVTSGVPQGSILGPLLFVLYINDLSNCLSSTLPFIYADDTKCIKAISTIDDSRLITSSDLLLPILICLFVGKISHKFVLFFFLKPIYMIFLCNNINKDNLVINTILINTVILFYYKS